MNETELRKTAELERRLARLVDGELSADEYRALLKTLDEEPEGWRRCALAFLESQALAGEFSSLRRAVDVMPPATAKQSAEPVLGQAAPPAKKEYRHYGLPMLAIAASFLAALALGIIAPRFFSPGKQEPSVASNYQEPDARHEVLRPAGGVRLVMDGGDGQPIEAGHVPVYEASGNLDQLLAREQAPMGPELIELFKRYGFDVQHQPQFVPAPLEDGRQLIVPVDGYQITPVGRRY